MIKLARIADARFHNALRKLASQPMPLRVAFKLKGIQAKVDEEQKKFEQCRQEALSKFGNKDADGKLITKPDNTVEFADGQLQAFAAELNDLGQTEVDIPTMKLEDLGDKVELSVDELFILDNIVVE